MIVWPRRRRAVDAKAGAKYEKLYTSVVNNLERMIRGRHAPFRQSNSGRHCKSSEDGDFRGKEVGVYILSRRRLLQQKHDCHASH